MGAIAVVASDGGPDRDAVARMLAASPHRGTPLGILTLGRVALGASDDPELPDTALGLVDGLAVAVTGILDDTPRLAAELGVPLGADGRPDLPSLIAAAWRADGTAMPARIRGLFAGIVTDGSTVYAFRDHIGYRPLFYRAAGPSFVAASEAKQVVIGAGIPKEPDLDVVERILFRSLDEDAPTALRGVSRLPKSSGVRWSGDAASVARYWEPERLLETGGFGDDELQERFDHLFGQAVDRALSGRDLVSLSGGIDSPAIAAYAAPRHLARFGTPLKALTVVYPKYPSVDERRYVEPVAAELGLELHTYEQEANPVAEIDRWAALTDTPYAAGSLSQYAEDYGRAKALGARTVLSGEHAEFVTAMQWTLIEHYLWRGRFGPLLADLRYRRRRGRPWGSLLKLVLRSAAPDQVVWLRDRLAGRGAPSIPAWIDERRVEQRAAVAPWDRWRQLQLTGFVGPGVSLEAEEICQAVSGVRSRKPWTDIDLWEFFLRMPAEQKFPDQLSKGLVRRLLRGRVPDLILDRTDKTVFDEAGLAQIDYQALRRLILDSPLRVAGVDYAALERRLEAGDLSNVDYGWARSLASVHAFLGQW